MIKQYKINSVKYLKTIFSKLHFFLIININTICAEDIQNLRKNLVNKNICIQVFKNTLLKHVIKDTTYNKIYNKIVGQTAFLWCNDSAKSVETIKIIYNLKKKIPKIEILCGYIEQKIIDTKYSNYISKIPNLNTLRCNLLNIIVKILIKLLNTINYQSITIINILKQKYKQ